jgi:hypothetical protein
VGKIRAVVCDAILGCFWKDFICWLYLLILLRILTVNAGRLKAAKGVLTKVESDLGCLEVLSGSEMLPKGRKIKNRFRGLCIGRGKIMILLSPTLLFWIMLNSSIPEA